MNGDGTYFYYMDDVLIFFWHVVGSQLPDDLDMCSKEERAEQRIAIFPLSIWAFKIFPI